MDEIQMLRHKIYFDKDKDFEVRICEDCNNCFTLDAMQIEYFKRKDLKLPCKCIACRKKSK